MSIQPGRVVWRIVDEVARGPRVPLALEHWPGRDDRADERVELARSTVASWGGAPPFATLFHFWTHALRAFLEGRGEGDQLEGAAGFALCEQLPLHAIERERERYREGVAHCDAIDLAGQVLDGYRMMAGPCRASIVVETDAEWCALFRSHGPRSPVLCVA